MRKIILAAVVMLLFSSASAETLAELQVRTARTAELAKSRALECQTLVSRGASAEEIRVCMNGASNLSTRAARLIEDLKARITEEEDRLYGWRLRDEDPSPIDDSPTILLSKTSRTSNTCHWGDGRSTLTIQCREGQTEFYFSLNGCVIPSVKPTGIVRVGTSTAAEYELRGRDQFFAIEDKSKYLPLVRDMLSAERLVFRTTPFSDLQQTIVFDITGLEEAITPLREACH